MTLLGRLRRRPRDRRAEAARAAVVAGDFVTARAIAGEVVGEGGAPTAAVRSLAELDYLLGRYAEAEEHFLRAAAEAGDDLPARLGAEAGLALVYLQTNRFSTSRSLFAGAEGEIQVPIWELMRSFGDEPPYRVDWSGEEAAELRFVQEAAWELPRVSLEIDGLTVEARLDTGGDLLVLTRRLATELGVEPVAWARGEFAGGVPGSVGYGRVGSVRLGGIAVEAVPVSVLDLDLPMIGTGFLRQFLATLDHPGRRLVLRPPGSPSPAGIEVPFALAVTHLLLARGSLNGLEPLTFIVDSGLQEEGGAALTVPEETLVAAGIPVPETREEVRESGAGHVPLYIGRFPVAQVGLGPVVQSDLTGLYGIFPSEWSRALGFPVHGMVSHGFLRRYAWTLDFERMTMTFAT